ncbi:MAG: hypothetical protein PF508_04955 [Spirochaeta sp.]|jgi:hypothetical protein|nr:hypothetical protein [Spirochaeta sp.]
MKRTQVLLTEEQQREIKRIAKSESISAGAVIRRLIDRGLADARRNKMADAAEKMAVYYAEVEDTSFREIDPWVAEEPGNDSR